jgi:hypothetical protein
VTRYQGLDPTLSTAVRNRDRHRCRWCGRTDQHLDLHHIRYRRGFADDVEDNLISLCRRHHDFIHGTPNPIGETIIKEVAQQILRDLITMPGVTGLALWRQRRRAWLDQGLCEHGEEFELCYRCAKSAALPNGSANG